MNTYMNCALLTFFMVAVSLALISLALYGLRGLARVVERRPVVDGKTEGGGVDEEIIAVLAAAAHAALRKRVRIRRIHVHHNQDDEQWCRAGRVDIMHSHRVKPRR